MINVFSKNEKISQFSSENYHFYCCENRSIWHKRVNGNIKCAIGARPAWFKPLEDVYFVQNINSIGANHLGMP